MNYQLGSVSRAHRVGDEQRASNKKGLEALYGAGFWSDFGHGFKKGFTGALGVASSVAPLFGGSFHYPKGFQHLTALGQQPTDLMYGNLQRENNTNLKNIKGGKWWEDALSLAPLLLA